MMNATRRERRHVTVFAAPVTLQLDGAVPALQVTLTVTLNGGASVRLAFTRARWVESTIVDPRCAALYRRR